jgi:hypothetical protein
MPNITPSSVNIPPPAGAEWVDSWDWDVTDEEIRWRLFYGTRRATGAHRVNIIGTQAGDGTVEERLIAVEQVGRDSVYFASPLAAREAAAGMLAAADDWEAALLADKQSREAMACPLCLGDRYIYETDDTFCFHDE